MRRRSVTGALVVIAVLFALDYGSKEWVRQTVPLYEMTPLIPQLMDLTHVQNHGVSFSIMSDWPELVRLPLLIGISAIAVLGMVVYLYRYWNELDRWTWWALVVILPGALGNLIDRALQGYVTDFLHFRAGDFSFFVNNLADIFISVGVLFLAWSAYQLRREQEAAQSSSGPSAEESVLSTEPPDSGKNH